MSIERDFKLHLAGQAALVALVGTRFYSLHLPQGVTLPALVYQRVNTPRARTHSGSAGLNWPEMQWTVWARSSEAAANIAPILRAALNLFPGTTITNEFPDYDDRTGFYGYRIMTETQYEEA